MKKIIHVFNNGDYSGSQNVCINISKLVEGYEHFYVSPSGSINNILKRENINHIIIDKLNVNNLKKVIKVIKPDIVHAHDFKASFITYGAKKWLKNKKIISHLHNNDPRMKKISLCSTFYRLTSSSFDEILVVSDSVINEYIYKSSLKNPIVLPNIVNPEQIFELSKTQIVDTQYDIVFIARLVEQKDPIRFLRILKQLVESKSNLKVALIGDGNLMRIVRNKIQEFHLNNNVDLYGYLDNPYPYLANSKMLVLTSKYEGFGLVAVESLLFGHPVISTNAGGLPKIVTNKCGKICISDGDFIKEITRLIEQPEYYNFKSNGAKQRVKDINKVNEFISKLKKIYG